MVSEDGPGVRGPLSRRAVLDAAVALADAGGVGAVSMRKLGQATGVEAMSLYTYVSSKEDLLDGMIDLVFAEVDLPPPTGDWKPAMRRRAAALRRALSRHRWAVGLLDSRRTPGPATLRHHDAVIGCLRSAGFSVELTVHAFSLLDSYVYGFVLQEQSLPFDTPDETAEVAQELLDRSLADSYPHLAELAREQVLRRGHEATDEFEFGLDLVLDGLERIGPRPRPSSG